MSSTYQGCLVGGRYSTVRDDWENICWRALTTSIKGQVKETKLSMTLISSEESVRGLSIRWHNVVVRSGLMAHLRYEDFFPKGGVITPCQGMKCRESICFCRRHDVANVDRNNYILTSCPFQMIPTVSLHQSH